MKHKVVKKNNTLKIIFGLTGIALAIILIVVLRGVALEEQNAAASTMLAGGLSQGAAVGEETIRMAVESYQFVPNTLIVNAGEKVTWIVDGTRASGCTRYLVSQQLGINRKLVPGENVIEFTAPARGAYRFSCGMGMVSGTINVV